MQYLKLFVFTALLGAVACSGNHREQTDQASVSTDTMTMEDDQEYDTALVANKKDPVCGMPVKAGIYDTAHYNGMVLGFCSSSCKDSFLLKPAKYTLTLK